jgi:hypothetical protein
MPVSQKAAAALAIVFCLTRAIAFSELIPRSVSSSRQFIVYGDDLALRGAICDLAERTKSNLLHFLQTGDNWKIPLVVRLEYPEANFPDAPPARFEVSQLGYGLKLQLNLLVTREIDPREIERELLRAILVEMIYRDRSDLPAGSLFVAPPDWLLEGAIELQPGADTDESARLLQSMLDANKLAPFEDIVRQDCARLDRPARRLYDAYSQALLRLLLDAPDGHRKLLQYLLDLPSAPNDSVADLIVHFPDTLGRSPGKWWALGVASLAASDRYEVLSAPETLSLLDRLLHFTIPNAAGKKQQYSLGDHPRFLQLPEAHAVLEQVSRELLLLSARAHPSYRAIVQEDYEIVQLLVRGKTRDVGERLARIARARKLAERQTREIDDYLNWYEATQLKTMSGAFTEVLKQADQGEKSEHRRRDPISVYLDSLETEME